MADPLATRTASDDDADALEREAPRPHLFLVLECHRPTAAGVRIALDHVSEVTIGRGAERRIEAAAGRVSIALDDPWLSTGHARLARKLTTWTLEDAGSKNGSLVNGQRATTALLHDGDLLELGRTFFLFDSAPVGDRPIAAPEEPVPGIPTLSVELAADLRALAQVAPSRVPVILRGESGTGKELAARALHGLSGRAGPLVAVNCGAIPDNLVESELFGYRKGAFSGASEDRLGFVRAADGGTLLLDEIGDLRPLAQAALLRALQEHEVTPLGTVKPVPVDLRVVAATHRDLDRLVDSGSFRHDLHARLAGFQLELPPLRQRREDLGLMIGAILRRAGAEQVTLHPRLCRALFGWVFPGNVRELEQCLTAAVVLAGDTPVNLEHAPEPLRRAWAEGAPPPLDPDEAARRDRIVALLREHHGNVAAVARSMGKARMQIQRWIKRYAIRPRDTE